MEVEENKRVTREGRSSDGVGGAYPLACMESTPCRVYVTPAPFKGGFAIRSTECIAKLYVASPVAQQKVGQNVTCPFGAGNGHRTGPAQNVTRPCYVMFRVTLFGVLRFHVTFFLA